MAREHSSTPPIEDDLLSGLFSGRLSSEERDKLAMEVEGWKKEERKDEFTDMTSPELLRYYRKNKEDLGMRNIKKGELDDIEAIRGIIRKAVDKKERIEKEKEADDVDLLVDYEDCEEYISKKKLGIIIDKSDSLDHIKQRIREAEEEKMKKEQTPGTQEYIERMLEEKKWGKGQFEYNRAKNAWVCEDLDGKKYVIDSNEDEQPVEGLEYLFSKIFHEDGEYKGKPKTLGKDIFLVSLRKPYPDGHKTRREIKEEKRKLKDERRKGLRYGDVEYAREFVEDGVWKKGKFRKIGDEWVIERYEDGLKIKYIVEAQNTQPYSDLEYYFTPSEDNVVFEGNEFKGFNPSDIKEKGGKVVEKTFHVNLMPPYPKEHSKRAQAEAEERERREKEETYGTEEYAQKKEREKEWMSDQFVLKDNKWQINTKSPNDGRDITCVVRKNDPNLPMYGLRYCFSPISDGRGGHKEIGKDIFLVKIEEPLPEGHIPIAERERVGNLEQDIIDYIDTDEIKEILTEDYVTWILEGIADKKYDEIHTHVKGEIESKKFSNKIKEAFNNVLYKLEEIDPSLKDPEEKMSKEELKEKISKIVSIFGKEKEDAILQFGNSLDEPFDKGWLNTESASELMEALEERNQARAIKVLEKEIDRNDLNEADQALGTIIDKVNKLFERSDLIAKKKDDKKVDKKDKAPKKKTNIENTSDQKKEFNEEVQFRGDNLLNKFGKENKEKIGELIGKIRDLINSNSMTVDSANGILDSVIKEDSGAALISLDINQGNADSANKKTFEEIKEIVNSLFEEKKIDDSVQDEGVNEDLERDTMTPAEEIVTLLENTTFNGANDRVKKGILLRIATQLSSREYDKAMDNIKRFFDVTLEIEEKIEELKNENPVLDSPKAQEGVAATFGSEGGKDISPLEKQRNIVRRQIESFASALSLEKNAGVIRNALLALNTDYPNTALRFLNNYGLNLNGGQKEKFDNSFGEVEKQLGQFRALKDIQPEEDFLDLEEKTIVKLGIQVNRLIREFIEDNDEKKELIDEIGNFGIRTEFAKIKEVKEIFNDLRNNQDPDRKDEAFRDIEKILNKIIEKQKSREGEL